MLYQAHTIPITLRQCAMFQSGWSLSPEFIYQALRHTEYYDNPRGLMILEFGAGDSTNRLAELLTEMELDFRYTSWENRPEWASERPDIDVVLYKEPPTTAQELSARSPHPGEHDLVIFDGPDVPKRTHWYPLIYPLVRYGTVLAIDDIDHDPLFRQALDDNFMYDTLHYHGLGTVPSGVGKNWLIVRLRGRKEVSK